MNSEEQPYPDEGPEKHKGKALPALWLDGLSFFEGSARNSDKRPRRLGLPSHFVGDMLRTSNSPSPRQLRLMLTVHVAVTVLLALGLLAVHMEVAHLREVTTMPMAEAGRHAILRRLCHESSLAKDLHGHLRDVVLIININYEDAARSTSHFLRQVYGRFFDNIVIISPKSIPELGIEARGQHVWTGMWYWAFWHIPKVMADYPEAAGYLWTNDDVAINYWNLLKANKSKIWMPNDPKHPETRYFPFKLGERAKFSDWAASNLTRIAASLAYSAMGEPYRKQMDESVVPHSGTYPKRITDLFFIPRRFAKALSFDLIPVYREYKLWSEVAIPMMLYSLDHPRNWDPVFGDMVFRWDHWNKAKAFDPTEFWTPNVSAFHPWKLSKETARMQFIMAFSQADPCILELLSRPAARHH